MDFLRIESEPVSMPRLRCSSAEESWRVIAFPPLAPEPVGPELPLLLRAIPHPAAARKAGEKRAGSRPRPLPPKGLVLEFLFPAPQPVSRANYSLVEFLLQCNKTRIH